MGSQHGRFPVNAIPPTLIFLVTMAARGIARNSVIHTRPSPNQAGQVMKLTNGSALSHLMDVNAVEDDEFLSTPMIVMTTIFLFVSLSLFGAILVFCKKKNSVFALQKCEEETSVNMEMDDISDGETEIEDNADDEGEGFLNGKENGQNTYVKSATCPDFQNFLSTPGEMSGNLDLYEVNKDVTAMFCTSLTRTKTVTLPDIKFMNNSGYEKLIRRQVADDNEGFDGGRARCSKRDYAEGDLNGEENVSCVTGNVVMLHRESKASHVDEKVCMTKGTKQGLNGVKKIKASNKASKSGRLNKSERYNSPGSGRHKNKGGTRGLSNIRLGRSDDLSKGSSTEARNRYSCHGKQKITDNLLEDTPNVRRSEFTSSNSTLPARIMERADDIELIESQSIYPFLSATNDDANILQSAGFTDLNPFERDTNTDGNTQTYSITRDV